MSTEKMQDAGRNNERPARRFERKKARQSKQPSVIPSRIPISRLEQPVGCRAAERLFVPKMTAPSALPCTARHNARILCS